jgi:F-type H+-transporting ATPase subunit delta
MKTAVARRYAKALFDLLDQAAIEPVRATLQGLAQAIIESPALRHVIASPAFSEQDKLGVLTAVADRYGCPPLAKNFLDQLVKKNRVGFVPDIAEAFVKLVDASKGREQITVSSAAALPAHEEDRIRTKLGAVLRRDVDVTFHADAAQLAGLRIRLGSTVIDSTVQGRLAAMQRLLTKE